MADSSSQSDRFEERIPEQSQAQLRAKLRAQLLERGVELMLGDALRELPPSVAAQLETFTVMTNSGRQITANIWFQCFGVTPVSDYLDGDLAAARQPHGAIAVGPALQVAGHNNVFAIGDVSNADVKMAGVAGRQAELVAENIRMLAAGGHDLAAYQPAGPAIIVPIGPDGGSGQIPGEEGLAPREMVAAIKGQDLMVGRFADVLGLTSTDAHAPANATKK